MKKPVGIWGVVGILALLLCACKAPGSQSAGEVQPSSPEGQQSMNEKFAKLDQVAEDVEEIKVTALEAVTKDYTSQIRELKIAK